MPSLKLLLLAALATTSHAWSNASSLVTRPDMLTLLPASTLWQLQPGTWLENIVVRPNKNLLLTQLEPEAILYQIRVPTSDHWGIKVIANITSVQNLLGITPVRASNGLETYLMIGGNSTQRGHPVQGSFAAWIVTFFDGKYGQKADIIKISDLSEKSWFLNGVAEVPGAIDTVLIADSALGCVGRLDIASGFFDVRTFVFAEMKPVADAPIPIGVNGIKVHDGYLYWTNTFRVAIFRIAITRSGYPVRFATPELVIDLAGKVAMLDDFTMDKNGHIYVATNRDNSVVWINPKTRDWRVVAGAKDKMIMPGATAVGFGTGPRDKDILYVTTSGGLANPIDGKTEGAKVVAVFAHI